MDGYYILTLTSLIICLAVLISHLIRLISLGKPKDFAETAGNEARAIRYSFTGGMSPVKKESAYLHIPTYAAGMFYHLGTFLSLGLFVCILLRIRFLEPLNGIFSIFLMISTLCGTGILIKRILKQELRSLSNPDDYISNILVTAFQAVTIVYLFSGTKVYFLLVSLLLLYLPLGKLKHLLYFFAARYHLGLFYGRRGVWPPANER